jgi:hypothetical protein
MSEEVTGHGHLTPIEPAYPFNLPDEPISLYSGEINGIGERPLSGEVVLDCHSKVGINWEVRDGVGPHPKHGDEVQLGLVRHGQSWNLKASQGDSHWGSEGYVSRGWVNFAEYADPSVPLVRFLVHWMNLPKISGNAGIIHGNPDGSTFRSSGRWEMIVEGWSLKLDMRRDYSDVTAHAKRDRLFLLTHVMEIKRVDGAPVDLQAVRGLIECLRVTLSFAFGRWVGPAICVGCGLTGEVGWEEWRSPICDPLKTLGAEWIAKDSPGDLIKLVEAAVPAFQNPGRPGITRYQMCLAVQAVEVGFLEQRILAATPALEHLAWVNLVLGGRMTSSQYQDSYAEDRLRYLLEEASISTAIDAARLPSLHRYADSEKLDGPSAVTRVRNRLIHPQRPDDQIYKHEGLVKDVWVLTRYYVTMLVLFSIDYRGSCGNLLHLTRWAGAVETVPWAVDGMNPVPPKLPPRRRSVSRRARGQRRNRS